MTTIFDIALKQTKELGNTLLLVEKQSEQELGDLFNLLDNLEGYITHYKNENDYERSKNVQVYGKNR